MSDTFIASETVVLYRKYNEEIIGTPALVDAGELEKEDIVAAINNAGAFVYVNDSGVRDRVYININYDDEYGFGYNRFSFAIDADLPTYHRLRRSLENADLVIVRSPNGKFTLASLNVDEQVQAEIERSADNTYKVLKIIEDDNQ
jgi:hypothetical protein